MSIDVEKWQRKLHEKHDNMADDGAHGVRYIVGRDGRNLADSISGACLNECAALLEVAEYWGSGLRIQVLDVNTWTLYVFETGHGDPPLALSEADEIMEKP